MMPDWVLSAVAGLLLGVGLLAVVAACLGAGLWLVERILMRLGWWRDLTAAVFSVWEKRQKDTEARVLAVLRAKGEQSALSIQEALGLGQGVYRVLRGMERRGLLASRESEPVAERGGRPRVYYRLPGGAP